MSLAAWMTGLDSRPETQEEFLPIDGARMRCLISGHGPAVLLLHGLLGTADAWSTITRRLAVSSQVYSPDALGIGGSERRAGLDVSLRASAARMIALMDAQQIACADIVGTSHGGAVAMMLAALYPERVRSLVLHAPANPFSDLADPLIRFYRTPLGRWFANQVPTAPDSVQALALGRMYGDASRIRAGSLEGYITSLRVPGTIGYVLGILERWEADMRDLESVLPRLRNVPALLLWGDRDRAVSIRSGERLAGYFDRSTLIVMPGAGHLPHEELPAVFAGVVNSFLNSRKREEQSQDDQSLSEQSSEERRRRGLRLVPRPDAA